MDSSMEEIGSSTDGATSPPIQQVNHILSVSLMVTYFHEFFVLSSFYCIHSFFYIKFQEVRVCLATPIV